MNQVRTAAIGLGARGYSMLHALLLHMDNVRITAVCDLYEDRLNRATDAVEKVYGEGNRPFASTDYKEVLDRDDVDAVLIMSAWESHFPIAIYAMERGVDSIKKLADNTTETVAALIRNELEKS